MFNALAQQFKAEQPAQEAQQNNADMVARRKERRREKRMRREREREKRVRSFFEVFFPFLSLGRPNHVFLVSTTLPIINLCSMPPRDSISAITLIRLLPLSLFLGRPNQVFLVGTTLPIKIYVLRLRAILSLLLR